MSKPNHVTGRRVRLALTTVIAMSLSACSILPKSEMAAVYQLPALSPAAAVAPVAARPDAAIWALRVDTPYSSELINSQRIVVRPPGDKLSVYKDARWADTGPVLLRNRIVDAFRTQASAILVSSDSNRLLSDLLLQGDLGAFQVNYEQGAPVVHIQFDATLVQPADNRAVATRRFDIHQPVSGTQLPEVVSAFGLAADHLSAQLVNWVLQDAGKHITK